MAHNIKLIAFDLDGTLLDSSKQIPKLSVDALGQLRKNGILLTIVTGRPLYSTLRYIHELNLDSYFSISDSSIVLNRDGDSLRNSSIEPDVMNRIRELAKDHNCRIVWATNRGLTDDFFISKSDYAQDNMREFIRVEGIIYSLDEKLLRVKNSFTRRDLKSYIVFILGLQDDIRKLSPRLESMRDHMTVLANIGLNPTYHDKLVDTHELIIMRPKDCDKLDGLIRINNHYQIPLENTMFFGDWYNDIEALNGVGYPVLMSNAPEDIERGEYHVTSSNDENGVVKALEHYGLLDL